jgi:NitT/TauT family transport system substrate-binding protein
MLACLPYETITFLPWFVGCEKGFFRDAGVDLDYLYYLSGGLRGGKRKMIDLCVSGEMPFFSGVSTVVESQLRGWADVKAVAASFTRGSSVFVRTGIATVDDLRAKRVMVGVGASRNEVLYFCRVKGWDPERDLEIIQGDEVARREAFTDGSIDAVCARLQYKAYADQHGFRQLDLPGAQWYEGGVCTTAEFIQAHPDTVEAVVKGWARAVEFIRHNREEAVAIGDANIRWLDAEGVASQYDVIDFGAAMHEDGLRWMAGVLGPVVGSDRQLTPGDVSDLRFLPAAGVTPRAAPRPGRPATP